jgi:hypothetical protein
LVNPAAWGLGTSPPAQLRNVALCISSYNDQNGGRPNWWSICYQPQILRASAP